MQKGQRVRYIPSHAKDRLDHPNCEDGVVSSVCTDEEYVFVKYDNAIMNMITGDEPYTAQKTRVKDLFWLE